jgi:ribonuclease BN (tRNA processing enzyme)
MRRLLEAGRTIFDITHLLITHFHPDHSAELVPMLFATKYPDVQRRQTPLVIMGGQGLGRFYRKLQGAYGDWIVLPPDRLSIFEFPTRDGSPFALDECRITAHGVDHRPESLAFRFETREGQVLTVSGDSDECPGLVDAARDADLFICECAYPDEMGVDGHLTPGKAGRIARQARARRLVLTHLYPPCDEVDIVKQAEKGYQNGPVTAARDLMHFDLA